MLEIRSEKGLLGTSAKVNGITIGSWVKQSVVLDLVRSAYSDGKNEGIMYGERNRKNK